MRTCHTPWVPEATSPQQAPNKLIDQASRVQGSIRSTSSHAASSSQLIFHNHKSSPMQFYHGSANFHDKDSEVRLAVKRILRPTPTQPQLEPDSQLPQPRDTCSPTQTPHSIAFPAVHPPSRQISPFPLVSYFRSQYLSSPSHGPTSSQPHPSLPLQKISLLRPKNYSFTPLHNTFSTSL